MGKADQSTGGRLTLGRLSYPYYDRPGFSLLFLVSAQTDRYVVTLQWNGTACRRAGRGTLAGALTWARREADRLLVQFGLPAKQAPLGELLTEVEQRLAA